MNVTDQRILVEGFRLFGQNHLDCDDPEVCDGLDNDCDGLIDEGATNACGDCGPVPPEVCDGLDNDCDGEVDEGCDARG